jgi:hypothetical protein
MRQINLSKPIVNFHVFFSFKKYKLGGVFFLLVTFDTPSTFAISIYSLFYLLYILYPNNLRRELQPETNLQLVNSNERPTNRLGIERVLLVRKLNRKKFTYQ